MISSNRAEAIQFRGTGASCDEVTDFLGGPFGTAHEWRSNTREGGYILSVGDRRTPFVPGDWIIKSGVEIHVARPVSDGR
jgi:hypothetical protein